MINQGDSIYKYNYIKFDISIKKIIEQKQKGRIRIVQIKKASKK